VKHIWLWWHKGDVRIEHLQAQQEGRDLAQLEPEFAALEAPDMPEDAAFQQRVKALFDASAMAPMRSDYAYAEPSDLPGIQAARPQGPRQLSLSHSDAVLADHIHGAWLGRCGGCLLGKPVEGWRTNALWPMLRDAGHATLTDYFWRLGITPEILAKHKPGHSGFTAWDHMPEDDDTNYTITGMALVKRKGIRFQPSDMADFWMSEIPILHTCTAERVAYRNFVNEITPPQSAVLQNPYREWIGAQIRADFFGYVALGRPAFAAELAWRDASISHIKNGIYGEMWVAAMLAAAPALTDTRQVIEIGLSEVPARCRLTEDVRKVMAWHAGGDSYDQAVARLHKQWDEHASHDWCHTNSNAQIVTMGLLYGEGDYEKAITRAVWPGFDTDCNGATVGSIMGMMLGAKALPAKWTKVMNDRLNTGVSGYHDVSISGTAAEMFQLYLANRA